MKPFFLDWKNTPHRAAPPKSEARGRGTNERYARMIRDYWAGHGFDVKVHVVVAGVDNRHGVACILASNLVNGLPPGATVVGNG